MARRTLDRPPSKRYADTGGEVPPADAHRVAVAPERVRAGWLAEVCAVGVAVATALVLVIVGGLLASTTGLLFVAGVGGALTGLVLAGSTRPRERLRGFGIGLAIAAVAVGAVGTWLFARAEGGALDLVDFLWATTGLLVPAEAVVAALAATWGVRAGPIRG